MEASNNAPINLLMVDEPSFSRFLDHEGYRSVGIQAFMASSFEEARTVLAKHKIAVVLISWEYQLADPVKIITDIRSNARSQKTPIVVTSIHSADDKISKMKEIDLFVKQPVPRVILLERIRQLLKKQNREKERHDLRDLYLDNVKVKVGDMTHTLKLADISLSGIFLYSTVAFPKGQVLDLEFSLPGIRKPLRIGGEVIRITRMHKINDKMNKGIGIRFTEFHDSALETLTAYFEKNKPESNFMVYYL